MATYALGTSREVSLLDCSIRGKKNYRIHSDSPSMFASKQIGAEESFPYDWNFLDEPHEIGINIPSSISSEDSSTAYTSDKDVFYFEETTTENSVLSRDVGSASSLELPSLNSQEESNDCMPWLDFVAQYKADGEKCKDEEITTRKEEIMEELQMISETVQQMKLEEAKCQKKMVQKIKVDCPNCQRKVAAARFVPHLSKCFGNGGRECTRRKRSL